MLNDSKTSDFNNKDLEAECVQFMADNGLNISAQIITDGKIHRFSADENLRKPDEWYIAAAGTSVKGNEYFTCTGGSWSSGERCTYQSWKNNNSFSAEEKKEFYEISKKLREEIETHLKIQRDLAAKEATKVWEEAKESPPDEECSRYAKLKGVDLIGVKFGLHKIFGKDKDSVPVIIIDFRNAAGEIRTIQFIHSTPEGKTYKQWLAGGEKKGNFHIIGKIVNAPKIYVAEGWATGMSVHMASGAPVVVAGDAGNLLSVVENISNTYPIYLKHYEQYNKIVIAGDSDERGRRDAISAAKKVNGLVVFPKFPKDKNYSPTDPFKKLYTDFNDLHQTCGLEEVKTQVINTEIVISSVQDDLKNLAQSLLEKKDPCEDFLLSGLPEPLYAWISSLCETTDAHPIMVTSSAFATASGFLGKRLFLPKGVFFQDLHTNLWLLNVADSGLYKSTALNSGANLANERAKEINSEIKTLEDRRRREGNNKENEKICEDILRVRQRNFLLPNKMTGEAFIERLSQQDTGGVIFLNEFGAWLQNFEKGHNNDFKGMLTEFYDVPPSYEYATRTQGSFILEKPCFSICGVSTLTWLKENLKPGDVGSGFFARFLIFAPPGQNKIPPAFPENLKPFNSYEQKIRYIFERFDQTNDIYRFGFSIPAKKLANQLYMELFKVTASYNDKCQKVLEPYIKRWWPYLLKLAMIIRFFEDPNSKELSESALLAALTILLPAVKSTAQLFEGELGESEHQTKCRLVFEWICKKVKEKGEPVKRKALLSSKQLGGGADMYDYVLKTLIETGQIQKIQKDKKDEWEYSPK